MPGKKNIVKSVYDKAMKGRRKKAKTTTRRVAGKRKKAGKGKKA